ncbi:MAG: efflux RND transporter permease subunit [Salibacteraceae bacterium]
MSFEETKNKVKAFGITAMSIKNRTTVMVLTFIIFVAGLGAYNSMPKEAFPEIVMPEIYVSTIYPGNSPLDIEKLVTRPIEKEVKGITGIDEITSSSLQGVSSIKIKFDFSVTPEQALRKVKDKVDVAMADPDFPSDLPADPNVFDMNFSELMPILNINLSGDFSLDMLNEYAEYLEDKIEDIPQINEVDIRGINDKEVKVELDLLKMEATKINYQNVEDAINFENMTVSGGNVLIDGFKRSIRVVGEFSDWRDIENIIVGREKGNIVYLRDVGTVSFGEKEKESYAREYTKSVVSLDVKKRGGENLIEASEAISLVIAEAQKNYLPEGLNITITNDQTDQTKDQLSELENSILFGMVLVIGVLLFFLGLRNALFVGIAIPLSMLLSFLVLSSLGVTLNIMVLFSLVLALGMLVDNGIVVVENIYRLMDEGNPPAKAALDGASEVAWPIIASTATTLAAFVPLALWPGMMGEFMRFLPITLMIVLSSSLFVALVINPVLTTIFMKIKEDDIVFSKKALVITYVLLGVAFLFGLVPGLTQDNIQYQAGEMAGLIGFLRGLSYVIVSGVLLFVMSRMMFLSMDTDKKRVLIPNLIFIGIAILFMVTGQTVSANFIGITATFLILNAYLIYPSSIWFKDAFMPRLEVKYDTFIKFALRGKNAYVFLGGTFVMLVMSIMLLGAFTPSVLFFPNNQPKYLNIFIEKPIGTDIEETNKLTKELEIKVLDAIKQFEEINPETGEMENFLVNSVIAQVGKGTSDPAQGFTAGTTPHKARITVSFVKFTERHGVNTNDVLSDFRDMFQGIPGVKITVDKDANGPPTGAPINIEIAGDNYEQLISEANSVKTFINNANIGGIEELKLDVDQGKPEMPITIDRDKARRLGVSTAQIGGALRTSLFGKEVSTYKDGEDDYPINIRSAKIYRDNPDALINQRITFKNMNNGQIIQIPISALIDVKKTSTFSAVKRKDLNRIITISSNVLEGYNPTEVVNEIKATLGAYEFPSENTYKFTGQQEEQAKEMAFLSNALLIAFSLIIFIIVLQFNATSTPVIIGTSVLFSLIGVLLGLVIFQMDFVVIMTMIGIISLAGIVVNNAIVLIDYTNIIVDRKKEEMGIGEDDKLPFTDFVAAIEEGGKTRLRPVLLTAITTVLGLLPLAIGLNVDFFGFFTELDPHIYVGGENVMFWGPMSWTIIFGLTFATFLTLVIVPVMYYIVNKLKYRLAKAL